MPKSEELHDPERRFLEQLFKKTGTDASATISMYEIGEQMNLDRLSAKRTAENLIGLGLLEVRTLSGAVGITPEGIDTVGSFQGFGDPSDPAAVVLGDQRIPDPKVLQALETLLVALKGRVTQFGFEFEALGELMADLKSIDAQLSSPKPKTAVLRACLDSIRELLKATGDGEVLRRIQGFLAEKRVS